VYRQLNMWLGGENSTQDEQLMLSVNEYSSPITIPKKVIKWFIMILDENSLFLLSFLYKCPSIKDDLTKKLDKIFVIKIKIKMDWSLRFN